MNELLNFKDNNMMMIRKGNNKPRTTELSSCSFTSNFNKQRSKMIRLLEYPQYVVNIADKYFEMLPTQIKHNNQVLTYYILLWFLSKFVMEAEDIWGISTISNVGNVYKKSIKSKEDALLSHYLKNSKEANFFIFADHIKKTNEIIY